MSGDADRLMSNKDIKINFTTPSGKKQESVYEAIKRRELSKESWNELVQYAREHKILFITTVEFPETVGFLIEAKVDAIKVSKGDINNVLLIDQIAKTNLPIILDGREKFEDVEKAIEICEKNGNYKIIIMHCPSGYPAENAGIHLNAIKSIQSKYNYPVGFADHSVGTMMNFAAIALDVKMLEKTITINKATEQVEHFMSLELNELSSFIQDVRAVEQAMGDPNILSVSRVEESARRSLVAKTDIKKGQRITREVIDFRRPGDLGISCAYGFDLLNKVANQDIVKDTVLQWQMFS